MKLYLLPLLLVGFIPFAVADTGYDYFDVLNPDGTHSWSTHEPYLFHNNQWVPFVYSNGRVDTAQISVHLNTNGTYSFYKDDNLLGSDYIVAKYADISNLNSWTYPNNLNNDTPDISWDGTQFTSSKFRTGVGLLDYKFVLIDGKWKTQLEATNFSALTSKAFGFDEILDLNTDVITFGTQQRNLDNFNGTTFSKGWLTANQGKVVDFMNGLGFDFDKGFENLYAVTVYDTGPNKSRLIFDYRTNDILLPNEKLVIDPTFGYTAGVFKRYFSALTVGGETNCMTGVAVGGSDTNNQGILRTTDSIGGRCQAYTVKNDISSLPTTMVATNATIRFDVSATSSPNGCDVYQVTNNPDTVSDATIWADIFSGNQYVSDSTLCDSTGNDKTKQLSSQANTDIISLRALSNGNFTFSMVEGNWDAISGTSETTLDLITGTIDLFINYSTDVVVVSNLSCTGQPYNYSCSWTSTNATGVTGYWIQTSSNNSTWSFGNQTLTGNVTSASSNSIYGIGDLNYIRVNGTYGVLNGSSSNVVTATTDRLPDAPTINLVSASTTQINIERTAGASNGGDIITNYDLRCELNNTGGWLSTQINATIANFYNYTGLVEGDDLTCQWRDRNGVGYSAYSANGTGTTYMQTSGTLTFVSSNIGDMFLFNGTLSAITAPSGATATLVSVVDNGVVTGSKVISNSLPNGGSASITFIPHLISDDNVHPIKLRITASNSTGTTTIDSAVTNVTREYDPEYFEAIDTAMGFVNYTISRSVNQDEINLKSNRELSGAAFNIECLYRSMTDAALNTGGTWHNYSSVYFMNDTLDDAAGTHYYIDCYNDGLLFQVVSYTNSSMLLAGIEVFDDTYGTFIGVPVGVFFIVLVAGMANQRTAPMWIIVILAIAGIMSTIGFFELETNVWALALIAALLGIIVGRKLF